MGDEAKQRLAFRGLHSAAGFLQASSPTGSNTATPRGSSSCWTKE